VEARGQRASLWKKCASSRGFTVAARARAVLVGPSPRRCRAKKEPAKRRRTGACCCALAAKRRRAGERARPQRGGQKEAHGGALLCTAFQKEARG
jgi:hypothetical protein